MQKLAAILAITLLSISCSAPVQDQKGGKANRVEKDWKTEVDRTLKLFGHRNWIVVADGAYPQQSRSGIKTIIVNADQVEVVEYVLSKVNGAPHISANIFIDKEMAFVNEKYAPGIIDYRTSLDKALEGHPKQTLLHEDIIKKLDESAEMFNVLVIKTELAIPYTSVFFQLECGYWNAEAENELRESMKM